MDNSCGVILEGGAMRSIFSAGVLDFFMEQGIQIPNVLAISAGAYVGMNYVSGQKGRCVKALIEPLREHKFLGVGTLLRKGTFFDMDYLFNEVPREKAPFDFEAFQNSGKRFITSTVDCNTGETVYHEKFEDEDSFYNVCKAANSLPPVVGHVTMVDGRPMLDGGMDQAIPICKALEEGWKKIIVIFTRDASYRKKEKPGFDMKLTRWRYRRYPKFLALINGRPGRYNSAIDTIEALEKEGRAFVLRPTSITVKNGESNVDKLMAYYRHGYESAKERYRELVSFLEK